MYLNARFSSRSDPVVMYNYGRLIVELASVTPDGMVVFFPSYRYMEEVMTHLQILRLVLLGGASRL